MDDNNRVDWVAAILVACMVILMLFVVSFMAYVTFFESHTKIITIEVVNGNQTSPCSYTLIINGQEIKSGALGPGEAIIVNQFEHWYGGRSIHVQISNGPLILKEGTYGDGPLRFILYPDHIEEMGT